MIPRDTKSPPARGRGLKLGVLGIANRLVNVAPRAGAWIETATNAQVAAVNGVAPRAGAWIETG